MVSLSEQLAEAVTYPCGRKISVGKSQRLIPS